MRAPTGAPLTQRVPFYLETIAKSWLEQRGYVYEEGEWRFWGSPRYLARIKVTDGEKPFLVETYTKD